MDIIVVWYCAHIKPLLIFFFFSFLFLLVSLIIFITLLYLAASTLITLITLVRFFWGNLFFVQQDFFRKLMDLFRVCEDLENIDGLHAIFKIVIGISYYSILLLFSFSDCCYSRFFSLWFIINVSQFTPFLLQTKIVLCWHAVLLNNPQIYEKIFGDELIMDIIGSLECKLLTCWSEIYFNCLL